MAVTTDNNIPIYFNTDADFRTYCQKVAALFVAAGLVNTADTGQINNTTVLKPSAASTFQGYEIYRMNDASQATSPIFIKVEYGSGSTSATRPALRWQVGTGTNGAGTLTGITTTLTVTAQSSTSTASSVRSGYAVSFTGGAIVLVGYDTTSNAYLHGIAIDRFRDGTGAPTTEGTIVTKIGATSSSFTIFEQVIHHDGGIARTARAAIGALLSPGTASEATDIGVFPQIPFVGQARNPGLALVSHVFSDIAVGTTFTVTRYTTPRTYRSMLAAASTAAGLGNASAAFAILYD